MIANKSMRGNADGTGGGDPDPVKSTLKKPNAFHDQIAAYFLACGENFVSEEQANEMIRELRRAGMDDALETGSPILKM
jgi:hypothetical protein